MIASTITPASSPVPGPSPVAAPGTDRTWQTRAACAGRSGEVTALFFSDEIGDIANAKAICSGCPVVAECLEAALSGGEQWGVWGGQLFVAGRVVMSKRRRGRPPKVARPEDQLPVVPFPERLRHLQPA